MSATRFDLVGEGGLGSLGRDRVRCGSFAGVEAFEARAGGRGRVGAGSNAETPPLGTSYDPSVALPDRFAGLGRCSGVCALTDTPLEAGRPIVAVLCEADAAEAGSLGLVRRDVAAEAWDAGGRPEGVVCFWRSSVPASNEERRPLDEGLLLDLLRGLAEETDPARDDLRLVLALVLLRRRRLRLVDRLAVDSGTASSRGKREERWRLEHRPADGEPWTVEVLTRRLSDEESRDVADELGRLLGGEVEAPG